MRAVQCDMLRSACMGFLKVLLMQVCIYAPPVGFKGQWTVAADLSAKLLEYCEASGWRVSLQAQHA